MNKRGKIIWILVIVLVILSVLILSAMFFGFGSDDLGVLSQKIFSQSSKLDLEEETEKQEMPVLNESVVNETINITNETQERLDPELWCNTSKKEIVTSDLFGEGVGEKVVLGVENITIGNITRATPFICEACHTNILYSETNREIDEWSNLDKLILLDDTSGECYKYVASKTYLFTNTTNATASEFDLIFSNKTLVKERWYDSQGRTCLITNKILKEMHGADC